MTAQLRLSGRLVSRALVALILVLATVGLVAPAAHADGDTIGIAGGPSGADGPDQRTRLSYQASPGQTVTDHYVVRNTGSTPQDVRVFATDAYNTADGAFALLDTDAKPTGPGKWVTFDGQPQSEVKLAPTEQKILTFTLVVPADATPGDHAAGIVVSATGANGQVRVDRRVATRMYVRVAGALQPNLTLSNITAHQAVDWNPVSGATDITVTVHNTGNVALGADVTAKVTTWFGLGTGRVLHDQVAELLPGATRSVTFHVADVGRVGYLKAQVRLQPSVAPDARDPGPLRPVVRETTLASVPWLALALIVVIGAFVLLARLRRRRAERAAAEWVAYTRAEAHREAETRATSTPEVAS
jgi:dihydroorotate dehydrogenase (fumarate)